MNANHSPIDAASSQSTPEKGPLPLVIGVTGHRNLRPEDVSLLEARVREIFVELQGRYPHTPLILLSSLAEGADRLAARMALQCGVRLSALLPMRRELYEREFATPASKAEFNALLQQAEQYFELPLVEPNSEADIAAPGHARDQQYALAGATIARSGQIFMALWDGADFENAKTGGTAQIVRFRLEGSPEPYAAPRSPLDAPETGPVHHIVTPRLTNPAPAHPFLQRRDLYPSGTEADGYERIYQRIELFNRDAIEQQSEIAGNREQSAAQLLGDSIRDFAQRREVLPAAAQSTLRCYAIADVLAIHFARLTTRALNRFYLLVFVAVLCFNLFDSLSDPLLQLGGGDGSASNIGQPAQAIASWPARLLEIPWFLVLFLGISVYTSVVLQQRVNRGDYQNKHQDYRALAEGLRVQFFWQLAGLPDQAADHYLSKQRSELEWIRHALRNWSLASETVLGENISSENISGPANRKSTPPVSPDGLQSEAMRLTRERWVQEQRNYYARKAHQEHEKLERDEKSVGLLIKLSVTGSALLALVLVLPALVPLEPLLALRQWMGGDWAKGGVMLLIVMPAVTAGMLHGYNQQRARSEHAKQFGRMSILFDSAARRLEALSQAGDHARAQALIRELGCEALVENGDWVLLHRERPLEAPRAS